MKNILALLLISLLFLGCTKPKEEEPPKSTIPPPSQTGANIFVCKVNGVQHVYQGQWNWNRRNGISYGWRHNAKPCVWLWATESKYDDDIELEIFEPDWPIKIGHTYTFTSEDGSHAEYTTTQAPQVRYESDVNSGQIIFSHCDEEIAAGTFSFTAFSSSGSKTEVTEGYFDIARTTP